MSQLTSLLAGHDLRSDGMATEVAELILENEELFDEILEGLGDQNPVVRGRSSDAIEKIARKRPDLVSPHLSNLIEIAKKDEVMMVRMHLAMVMGHILVTDVEIRDIFSVLKYLLNDKSVFTRSWTIVSLCILARKIPKYHKEIVEIIAPMKMDRSTAIRTKARKAIDVLLDEDALFPKGWIKSIHY
jgi:HEAT repeat protein